MRRETAARYLRANGVPIRAAGRWGHGAKPAIQSVTDPPADAAIQPLTDNQATAPGRSRKSSASEAYLEQILTLLKLGRNGRVIFEELVDHHGFTASYGSVQRFIKKLKVTEPDAHAIIQTAPGEEAQVDYGEGPMVKDEQTGRYRRTRLFVLTLGFSRKAVYLLARRSSTKQWCKLHEEAFRRLGGVAKVVVLDNLREGVLEADVYDPELNPVYRAMLSHYGAIAMPCRVGHPDRKGKVEAGIKYAQNKLKGLRFETLEAAQDYLDHWEKTWASTRIHGTTKRQVAELFDEEKAALSPLPLEPFRYFETGLRRVHLDGCVLVDGARYAPPPGLIGQEVLVEFDEHRVRILDQKTRTLLREHLKQRPGRVSIHPNDLPKRTPPTTTATLERARKAGRYIGEVCATIYARDGELGMLRILGVLSLAKKYGQADADNACKVAVECEAVNYRFIKRYLQHQAEQRPQLRHIDPLIRELCVYRDLIDRKH